MNGPIRAALVGFALAGASACASPEPRIPFTESGRWAAIAGGSARSTTDRYIHGYAPVGLEFISQAPEAAGWGWEFSARYGQDTGNDQERKVVKIDGQPHNVSVPNVRESTVYEINLGVRQTYFRDSRLQPYFGVGGTGMRIDSDDDLSDMDLFDPTPGVPGDEFFLGYPDQSSSEFNFGLYLRTGLLWRMTGTPSEKTLGLILSTDVRGMLGHEFDYIELSFGIGLGR